jgi:hypothetical protein
MLNPDDRNSVPPCLLNQDVNVRYNRSPRMSSRHDTVLHVDDEECGVWPVVERGHKVAYLQRR